MKVSICKVKGCEKQILDGEKCCSYHKKKKAENRGTMVKRALTIAAGATFLAITGKLKP